MSFAEQIVAAVEAALGENRTRSTPEHNAERDHERLVRAVEGVLGQLSGNPGKLECATERAAEVRRKHLPWDEFPQFAAPGGLADQLQADIVRAITEATAAQANRLCSLQAACEELLEQWPAERNEATTKLVREIQSVLDSDATERLADYLEKDRAVFGAQQAARIAELEAALQGRTVSCICGGEAERDKARLDYLQEEMVDTIYFDDGTMIDVRSGDLRAAIDAAMEGK